jgi:tetratricopeptide (TPR) repeat protein
MSMLPEAIDEYNAALSLNSQHYDALHNRGCAYRLLGRLEYALISFRQALSINQFYPALRGESACLISLHRWEEAATSASFAIAQHPSDPGPLADRAFALLKLCDSRSSSMAGGEGEGKRTLLDILEGVVSDFSLAISLGDDTPESRRLYGVALSHLAVQQVSAGEFERAEETYTSCIAIEETETRVLNQAQLYLRTNRTQLALNGFARAAQIDKFSPQAHFAYGTLLLEQGDVRQGLSELTISRNLIESSKISLKSHEHKGEMLLWVSDLHYNLGYAELLTNEPVTAKQSFEEAIRVNPKLTAAINGIAVAQKMIETSEAVAVELLSVAERRTLAAVVHHPALVAPIHPTLPPKSMLELSRLSSSVPDSQLASPTSSTTKALRRASSIVQTLSSNKDIESIFTDKDRAEDVIQETTKPLADEVMMKMSRLPSMRSIHKVLSTQSLTKDSWGDVPEEDSISARFRKGIDDDKEVNDGFDGVVVPVEGLRGLASTFPDGVNPRYREAFLSDIEFQQLFNNMTKKQFYSLAKWRRLDIKRSLKLF